MRDYRTNEIIGAPTLTNGGLLPADEDLGRLSAEAVQTQYEQAAKNVEQMGEAVQARIAALEASLAECDKDMKLLGEAANAIRDKGKLAYAHIEHTAQVSQSIRAVCAEFHKKFADGAQ
jgi:chromosome segregation ATPase